MDRIDIRRSSSSDFFEITGETTGYSSELLRKKVEIARKIQQERYSDQAGVNCNAQMTNSIDSKILRIRPGIFEIVKKNQ